MNMRHIIQLDSSLAAPRIGSDPIAGATRTGYPSVLSYIGVGYTTELS